MDYKQIANTPVITGLIQLLMDRYRDALKKSDSIATGNILKFNFSIDIDSKGFNISFNLPEEWKYIEYGRLPGKQPPIKAIENWIKVKPVVPRALNNKVPSTKQTAYLIARSIGRNGIRGKHLLTNTLSKSNDIMLQLKHEIALELLNQMANDINKSNK